MKHIHFFFGIILLGLISSCKNDKVTIESLLTEMTDRTAVTYFPENSYKLKQFSSYDRKTVSPDNNDWWANADYTQFIREENNAGHREFVLFDAAGPGAVVRWWMTFAGQGASAGTVRIYIDNSETPLVEGNILDILSGSYLAPEPLASSVSPETDYQQRGHNLYLPIPYSQHCKITYECDAVKFENNNWRPSIYYNIGYRTYDPKVEVESFTMDVLNRAKSSIQETAKKLLTADDSVGIEIKKSETLAENGIISTEFKEKGKAVSKIAVKLDAENINQALRSMVISISFDGKETVWIPAGEFFGTGYQIHTSQTWNSKVDENGLLEAFWLMPFKESANIKLINYGNQTVNAELSVSTKAYTWKNSSMYFGASWHEYNQLNTAKTDSLENHEWHFDVNYVDITGQGIYAGDALTVFNTVDAWWGEGDEKIFVDDEEFPSSIGTGTEDYYGYAWCRPEKFTHPFIAQPTGAGNFHSGMTVNMRYRSLDAIPFTKKISSNIEMWHWVKTKVNFAMSAFWYAKPGFQINIKPDTESVRIPVAMNRTDIYKPIVDENGKIEGEFLEVVSCGSGTATAQSGNFGWSRDGQLWWRNGETGSELIAKFILNKTGKFKITAQLTKAMDYGIIQLYINGIAIGPKFDGYIENGVKPVQVNLGTLVLSEGENILSLKILGANKNAKLGNMAGIDWLQFTQKN
ncbi:MAG TPA: glycoside hydrolase family 172 protein [Draconibacterium sp.]|nr:glycoside hydrolase family 172 protein [Draconibacterium sp.]